MNSHFLKPTAVLATVNVLVYIYTSVVGGSFLETNPLIMMTYGQLNILVIRGLYWQLFSSMFIHANVVHLSGNLLFLLIFGLRSEKLFNSKTYLIIYFVSGLLGNLLSLLLGPLVVSVGASGCIFGIFGAYIVYLGASFGRSITPTLIYGLYLFLLNVGTGVNILAHFGGLLAGILIGYVLSKRHKHMMI